MKRKPLANHECGKTVPRFIDIKNLIQVKTLKGKTSSESFLIDAIMLFLLKSLGKMT
jgi:hypothetical protein